MTPTERSALREGPAQSGDDFRRIIAESEVDIEALNYVVSNMLHGRGALDRETKLEAVKAIRSYQVILAVSRDPDGALFDRAKGEQS